ncbi:MAG: AI-2E family transporter [Chlorobi bacterium]|nr:AI-2E family transporter [Chlorobiota bacterium]
MKDKRNLQDIFFFIILISLSVAFFRILQPFIGDAFLALILVILFKKPFRFFRRKFKGNTRKAAAVTTLTVVVVIVIPVMFVGAVIVNEAGENYSKIKNQWPDIKKELSEEKIKNRFSDIPVLNKYVDRMEMEDVEKKLDDFVGTATEWTVTILQNTFSGLTYMLVHTFFLLFFLYFMFADGDELLKRLQYLIPMKDSDERALMKNVEKVTDGIVFNSFLLGALEGTYGGILFALTGVPSPVFWGIIMAALSVIPIVGTNSIMVPAVVIYYLIGDYTTGTILLIFGVGAVLINQNLIRPRLDAHKSGMHTAMALIASLGGLLWMGVIGFLAGPLITALFIAVWDLYGKKYNKELIVMNEAEDADDKNEDEN